MNESPEFGALAPTANQDRVRRFAGRLPANYFGRKAASLLLGPAGGRARRAFDVEIFGDARARLHPYDNISEKRVYLTPQFWEVEERAALAAAMIATREDPFWFVDVGANAGLYTLFALATARGAGRTLRALCVEPDPVMRARLDFNLAASGAGGDVCVAPFAAGATEGAMRFAPNEKSRGQSRADDAGPLEVTARPLLALVREAAAPRVDALKIDIEGAELGVLAAYFATAPAALTPAFLIAERSHEAQAGALRQLLEERGYAVAEAGGRSLIAQASGSARGRAQASA